MLDHILSFLFGQALDYSQFPQTKATDAAIRNVLSVIFTITGAIAVLMVVIGGIKYSSSQGDPQAVSKAKGTIIYAIVGLIVSIFAVAIVGLVAGRVG